MMRKKRDQQKRAQTRGYVVGLRGHGSQLCPFSTSKRRSDWLEGWRVGHGEHVQGFRELGT
jgi:ribosome modulation factor